VVNRYFAVVAAVIVVMLAAVGLAACGRQAPQAKADDLTAGNRAELVTLGGARLDPQHAQQVTVHVSAGQVRIIAAVTGASPALDCALRRLEGEGDAAHWTPIALAAHSRTAPDSTVFTLGSPQLEAGTYRLTYTGLGWLKYLGMGANYP
jgi:hypothetical protein